MPLRAHPGGAPRHAEGARRRLLHADTFGKAPVVCACPRFRLAPTPPPANFEIPQPTRGTGRYIVVQYGADVAGDENVTPGQHPSKIITSDGQSLVSSPLGACDGTYRPLLMELDAARRVLDHINARPGLVTQIFEVV